MCTSVYISIPFRTHYVYGFIISPYTCHFMQCDFEEESGKEGSDMDEEFDVLSGSGEETENSSEDQNDDTPHG